MVKKARFRGKIKRTLRAKRDALTSHKYYAKRSNEALDAAKTQTIQLYTKFFNELQGFHDMRFKTGANFHKADVSLFALTVKDLANSKVDSMDYRRAVKRMLMIVDRTEKLEGGFRYKRSKFSKASHFSKVDANVTERAIKQLDNNAIKRDCKNLIRQMDKSKYFELKAEGYRKLAKIKKQQISILSKKRSEGTMLKLRTLIATSRLVKGALSKSKRRIRKDFQETISRSQ